MHRHQALSNKWQVKYYRDQLWSVVILKSPL